MGSFFDSVLETVRSSAAAARDQSTQQRGGSATRPRRVGTFPIDSEDDIASLTATAAFGEAGRQGPTVAAQAENQARLAALNAAGGAPFPTAAASPSQAPSLDDVVSGRQAAAERGFTPPNSNGVVVNDGRGSTETQQQALIAAIYGDDPASLSPSELVHRGNVFQSILGAQQALDEAEAAKEEARRNELIRPYLEAAELQQQGIPDEIILQFTGVDPAFLDPSLGDPRAQIVEDLQQQDQDAQLIAMQAQQGALDIINPRSGEAFGQELTPERAAASLGFGAGSNEVSGRSNFGVPFVGDRGTEQDIPGSNEIVKEVTEDQDFGAITDRLRQLIQVQGASAAQVFAQLTQLRAAREEAGEPLPEAFTDIVFAMFQPMIQSVNSQERGVEFPGG